ncbi:MAG: single-stranded DNA-binding protein [Acidobacteria bacterium]|nr:single-stranded DNA-binding protein [Acidobacteriota bacterium]
MNKVILIGRLGRDPEDRVLPNGTPVANFSLATNHFRTTNGTRQQYTDWHRIVTFGRTAEQCRQYLRKGRLVCVEGSLRTRTWEKPPGERHYTTEVLAARVAFLDRQGEPAAEQEYGSDDEDGCEDAS